MASRQLLPRDCHGAILYIGCTTRHRRRLRPLNPSSTDRKVIKFRRYQAAASVGLSHRRISADWWVIHRGLLPRCEMRRVP
jgi:hypothetical protein